MRNVLADLCIESEAATALAMRLARAYDEAARRRAAPRSSAWPPRSASTGSASAARGHAFEAMECLGGNGYVEESGMPRLYREAPLQLDLGGLGQRHRARRPARAGRVAGGARGVPRRGRRGGRRRRAPRRVRRRAARRVRRPRGDRAARAARRRAHGARAAGLAARPPRPAGRRRRVLRLAPGRRRRPAVRHAPGRRRRGRRSSSATRRRVMVVDQRGRSAPPNSYTRRGDVARWRSSAELG